MQHRLPTRTCHDRLRFLPKKAPQAIVSYELNECLVCLAWKAFTACLCFVQREQLPFDGLYDLSSCDQAETAKDHTVHSIQVQHQALKVGAGLAPQAAIALAHDLLAPVNAHAPLNQVSWFDIVKPEALHLPFLSPAPCHGLPMLMVIAGRQQQASTNSSAVARILTVHSPVILMLAIS